MGSLLPRVTTVRHGETEWSMAGRHTGRTDVPLTPNGEAQARRLEPRLKALRPAHVWSSPLARARRTCELAGLGAVAQVEPDLMEWDYGEYEGLLTPEIRARRPGWDVFRDGCPGGESTGQMSARADRVIAGLKGLSGNVVVFSHGHFLRALAVRWVGLPLAAGGRLYLDPATLGALGFEHGSREEPVLLLWNETVQGNERDLSDVRR
jgi:broad specificity phosphatase PhoE